MISNNNNNIRLTSQNIRDSEKLMNNPEIENNSEYLKTMDCVNAKQGNFMNVVSNISTTQSQRINILTTQSQRKENNTLVSILPAQHQMDNANNHRGQFTSPSASNQSIHTDNDENKTKDPLMEVSNKVNKVIAEFQVQDFIIQIYHRIFSPCCPTNELTRAEFFEYVNGDRITPRMCESIHYHPKGYQITTVDTSGHNEINFKGVMSAMVQDFTNLNIKKKKNGIVIQNPKHKKMVTQTEMTDLREKIKKRSHYKLQQQNEEEKEESEEECQKEDDKIDADQDLFFECQHLICMPKLYHAYSPILQDLLENMIWDVEALSLIERSTGIMLCIYLLCVYVFVVYVYIFVCVCICCVYL